MLARYQDCYIEPTKKGDAVKLFNELRDCDAEECIGMGVNPYDACILSAQPREKTFTIRSNSDDGVIACFGVGDAGKNKVGCIWMLGTDRVKEISHTFLSHSKEWIDYLVEGYAYVGNVVSTKNKVSMRWLKWVGAEFIKEDPNGYSEFVIPNPNY